MDGISEGERSRRQKSHLSFDQELEACRQATMEAFEQCGPAEAARETFYGAVKEAMERVARHDMVPLALHSFVSQMAQARDRSKFEQLLDSAIDQLKQEKRLSERLD